MKMIFTAILVLCMQMLFAQTTTVDSLFEQFVHDIETEQAYRDGEIVFDDETRESYYSLMINSPVEALIPFTDHPNAAVRCHLFRGLVHNNTDDETLNAILEKHQNDTAVFNRLFTVRDYMKYTLEHRTSDTVDYKKMLINIRQELRVTIPGLSHGRISRDDLLRADSLVFRYIPSVNVQSFAMCFRVGERIVTRQSKSQLFTPAMKRRIKKLRPGDKVFFEDIMMKGPNGGVKQIGSVTMVII